ncbi:polysaccharide export protein [Pasteurella sp. PK-2025]|uniref:polysaccharide export protein n=1 Tax=unclassified Pasteurella TaxID=2621516 RepID=UPI003C764F5C
MCKLSKIFVVISLAVSTSACSLLFPTTRSPITGLKVYAQGEPLDTQKTVDAYFITPALIKQLSPVVPAARQNESLEQRLKSYQYRVGPGDILNITVWDHPELTTPAGSYRSAAESGSQVHANGTIFYPYVGNIAVAGLTVNQIRNKLTQRLAHYISEPQIEVNVAAYQSKKAYITGEVTTPGQQFLTNIPLTLLDAVNKAGGLSEHADWHNVTITSKGREEHVSLEALFQRGDLSQNRLLGDGDIVHVPRNDANKVFVIGEVSQPQMLKITHYGMTLTEAITASGGIDKLSADATGIFVIRGQRNNTANPKQFPPKEDSVEKIADIYQLDVTNATSYILGTEFYLKPYDVVYVTTAPITRWNRVITQVMPTISGFNSITESTLRIRNW